MAGCRRRPRHHPQAESAALSGGAAVATDHSGYTGSGFVGGYIDANKGNAATTFSVDANPAGSYTLTLRYANGTAATKSLSLYVRGTKVKQISLPATANWDSWTTEVETVTLTAGTNAVAYKFDTSRTPATSTSTTWPCRGDHPADQPARQRRLRGGVGGAVREAAAGDRPLRIH